MRTITSVFIALAAVVYAQSYIIKGPLSPKPYETSAMKELGDYLAKRIDGTLTIGGKSPVTFHVGDTDFAKTKGILSSQLKDEQWIIKSFDNNVILNGGGTRGALYAVYHFLEDFCDIHWWSEYEEYVPTASSLSLPALDKTGKPAFIYRDIFCYGPRSISLHGKTYMLFAVRNRLNAAGGIPITGPFGGAFEYGPPNHCHTFAHYFPEDVYFKEHPEYFALVDGKRFPGTKSQLCLTNPELRQLFLEKLLNSIEQGNAEAAKLNKVPPLLYDVSMNDVRDNFCRCPSCKEEIDKYGLSGHLLRFVNFLADNVAKKHPEVFITTLAYHSTEAPPKGGVRANDNVIIKLCDTTTNQAASILENENHEYKELVSTWSGYAKNVFIWDYSVVFPKSINTMLPFASELYYGDLFKHYLANNVQGIFWEHEFHEIADMYEAKWFMETKLMEDPQQDVEELLNIFFTKFYGAAGKYILQFRRNLDAIRKKTAAVITGTARTADFDYLDNDFIIKSEALFDEAEAAVADNPTALLHIRRARVGLDYLALRKSLPSSYSHGIELPQEKPLLPPLDIATRMISDFDAWAEHYPNAKSLKATFRIWTNYHSLRQGAAPVPKELEGRNCIEFHSMHFDNHGKYSITADKDSESPVGDVMKIEVRNGDKYSLPFQVGFYDAGNKKLLDFKYFDTIPEAPGYHWYKLPPVAIPSNGYVYLTRSWTLQQPNPYPSLIGKKFEVWVSAKHVGEQFHKGQGKPEYIYVDRIVFVEPEEKK